MFTGARRGPTSTAIIWQRWATSEHVTSYFSFGQHDDASATTAATTTAATAAATTTTTADTATTTTTSTMAAATTTAAVQHAHATATTAAHADSWWQPAPGAKPSTTTGWPGWLANQTFDAVVAAADKCIEKSEFAPSTTASDEHLEKQSEPYGCIYQAKGTAATATAAATRSRSTAAAAAGPTSTATAATSTSWPASRTSRAAWAATNDDGPASNGPSASTNDAATTLPKHPASADSAATATWASKLRGIPAASPALQGHGARWWGSGPRPVQPQHDGPPGHAARHDSPANAGPSAQPTPQPSKVTRPTWPHAHGHEPKNATEPTTPWSRSRRHGRHGLQPDDAWPRWPTWPRPSAAG